MKRYQCFSAAGILLAAVMFSTSQQVAAQILRIGEILGLVQQFPRMRLAEQRIEWAPNFGLRGLKALP
jgi:hypothetical protein